MSIQVRYLNWDGFYSMRGVCNQRRDPKDDVSRAQLHLTRLGFYRGPVDGRMNDALRSAVRHFNYFPDKPIQKSDVTLYVGPDRDSVYECPLVSPNNPTLPEELRPLLVPTDDVVSKPLLKKLDMLLPWPAPVEVDKHRRYHRAAVAHASRSLFNRIETGATLDAEELAVRVVEVPGTFALRDEYGVFRIKLCAFERIRSMMVRIYRQHDPANLEAPFDDIVYQEVLLVDDIVALPAKPPSTRTNTVGKHKPDAASMIAAKRWKKDPFFLMKQHAPYRVRCWVSTLPQPFDPYTDDAKIRMWDADEEVYELRRSTRDLTSEGNDDPQTSIALVHDCFRPATRDDPIWTVEHAGGVNLIEEPCDTHTPRFHDDNATQYFKANPPRSHIDDFAEDPVTMYFNMWPSRRQDDNFCCPEFIETWAEAKKHLNRMRQSLCCGRDSLAPQSIKDQILETIDQADGDLDDLRGRDFPYTDSCWVFIGIAKIAFWLLHQCRTIPEMQHHQIARRGFRGEDLSNSSGRSMRYRLLSHERNMRATEMPGEPDRYACDPAEPLGATCQEEYAERNKSQVCMNLRTALEDKNIVLLPSYSPLDEEFFTKTRQVPLFIVGLIDIPYLNADAHRYTPAEFATHDLFHTIGGLDGRKAQMWAWMRNHLVEACLSNPRSTANPRYIHIREFDPKGSRYIDEETNLTIDVAQTIARDGFPDDRTRRRVLDAWHHNAGELCKGRNWAANLGEPVASDFRTAYDIVLFCLLHEPMRSGQQRNSPYTRCFSPAVPDPEDLYRRIREDGIVNTVKQRAENHWFGPPRDITPTIIGLMDLAMFEIERIIVTGDMRYTRAIIHGSCPLLHEQYPALLRRHPLPNEWERAVMAGRETADAN